ncbi:MAG: MoxR family ATPase [Rubrivivax sp.]
MDPGLPRQLSRLVDQISTIIVGKRPQIEDCVACLLAGGHLLIEDVPGVGKTTLAHALAVSLGLKFSRVQFTADLMPSDLVGVSVFERSRDAFVFHPGPLFAQVLLADEINRAGPKTQSALLEAMEEHQVSVDSETRALPAPFFVIATQNPTDQLGTYPLPESQLDRFLLRITLGYPDRLSERALLAGEDRRDALLKLAPLMDAAGLQAAQRAVLEVTASEALLDYLQALIAATRDGQWFVEGLSPRAGIGVLRAAKARALMAERRYVAPDDVQAIFAQAVAHRLQPLAGAGRGAAEQVRAMVEATPIP